MPRGAGSCWSTSREPGTRSDRRLGTRARLPGRQARPLSQCRARGDPRPDAPVLRQRARPRAERLLEPEGRAQGHQAERRGLPARRESGFRPDVVISDFESWAALYGTRHGVPVISIDNMQIINRCRHDKELVRAKGLRLRARAPGRANEGAQGVPLPRDELLLPAGEKEVHDADPAHPASRGGGARVGNPSRTCSSTRRKRRTRRSCPRSSSCPIASACTASGVKAAKATSPLPVFGAQVPGDLRTARAVVCGGGFSLLAEAVCLGIPTLSIPVAGQYEQELNARYLEALGYGAWAPRFDGRAIAGISRALPRVSRRARWQPHAPRQRHALRLRGRAAGPRCAGRSGGPRRSRARPWASGRRMSTTTSEPPVRREPRRAAAANTATTT